MKRPAVATPKEESFKPVAFIDVVSAAIAKRTAAQRDALKAAAERTRFQPTYGKRTHRRGWTTI